MFHTLKLAALYDSSACVNQLYLSLEQRNCRNCFHRPRAATSAMPVNRQAKGSKKRAPRAKLTFYRYRLEVQPTGGTWLNRFLFSAAHEAGQL